MPDMLRCNKNGSCTARLASPLIGTPVPSIAETIRRLKTASPVLPLGPAATGRSHLRPLTSFGSNPGALNGWCYVPEAEADAPTALVVVLHGCTQTAAGYDVGSGWSELAHRYGFAVLFPEQQRANNANLCFNWFNAEDTRRGGGEAESIRRMIGTMVERHPIDPTRIFVTGLSAGGAMTSAMLAAYPEVFAGGGIIAGLPYGAAASMPEAFERMRGQGHPGGQALGDRVRAASSHDGPWPRISVWHGDADATVSASNADRIVEQWRGLHGVGAAPDRSETVDGHVRRVWLDRHGEEAIEAYRVAGMGHGTPLRTGGRDGCGAAGPHMLEAGISSTRRLAASWGLLGDERPACGLDGATPASAAPSPPTDVSHSTAAISSTVQATIENALRTAGLLK